MASASHSAAKRFGSASCTCSWLRVISDSPPPPSGAVSWPSSPSGRNADSFSAAYAAMSRRSAMLVMLDSSASSSVPGLMATGPSAPRSPSRWPRNWAVLYTGYWPPVICRRTSAASWLGASRMTSPLPASVHIRASAAATWLLPVPAGPTVA